MASVQPADQWAWLEPVTGLPMVSAMADLHESEWN